MSDDRDAAPDIAMVVPVGVGCISCRYELAGLRIDGVCPECGAPVAPSLPEARPGTPWQRSRTFGAWIATNRAALLRPHRLAATAHLDRESLVSFSGRNALAGMLILGALMVLAGVFATTEVRRAISPRFGSDEASVIVSLTFFSTIVGTGAGLAAAITSATLRWLFLSSRLSTRRPTPAVSALAMSIGTAWWVVACVVALLGWILTLAVLLLTWNAATVLSFVLTWIGFAVTLLIGIGVSVAVAARARWGWQEAE